MKPSDTVSRKGQALYVTLLIFTATIVEAAPAMAHDDARGPSPEGNFPRPDTHDVARILFSPDSRQLIGLGCDRKTKRGIIDFWDVKTHKLVRTLIQPAFVSAAAFTPDGKRLVTAGQDKKLYIHGGRDWQTEYVFDNDPAKHTGRHLAMFPDGKRFLCGSRGFQGPRIWDLNKRKPTPLESPNKLLSALAVSNNGKRFAVAYCGPITDVWDAEKLKVVGRLKLQEDEKRQGVFESVAFSPNGKTIATGYLSYEGPPRVGIWDAATFKKIRDCQPVEEPVTAAEAIACSADGKLLVACLEPGPDWPARIVVWEVETGKLVYQFRPAKEGPLAIALSPDGRWLVDCDFHSRLQLWDFQKIRNEMGKKKGGERGER